MKKKLPPALRKEARRRLKQYLKQVRALMKRPDELPPRRSES